MLDIGKYIIDEPYQQYGNGYDQLEGDYAIYYKVATKFCHKARYEDREDLLHTIILNLAIAHRNNGHKPDNPSWMYRIASYQVTEYWTRLRCLTTWLDCGNCSKAQRQKCRSEDLYSKCPKYHQLVSLNAEVNGDGDGEPSELIEFIADDKAVDIDAWLDARRILRGLPRRLVQIGYKRYSGIPLDHNEQMYLNRYRKDCQKTLF